MLATIMNDLGRAIARTGSFDPKAGYVADIYIDALSLQNMEANQIRWIVVREMGTAMFDRREHAQDHMRTLGSRCSLLKVTRMRNYPYVTIEQVAP